MSERRPPDQALALGIIFVVLLFLPTPFLAVLAGLAMLAISPGSILMMLVGVVVGFALWDGPKLASAVLVLVFLMAKYIK